MTGNGTALRLPVDLVLQQLEPQLKSRLRPTSSVTHFEIPLAPVLLQVPSGEIKIQFGEIRQATMDLFARGSDLDQTWIILPFEKIAALIDPRFIAYYRTHGLMQKPGTGTTSPESASQLPSATPRHDPAKTPPAPGPSAPAARPEVPAANRELPKIPAPVREISSLPAPSAQPAFATAGLAQPAFTGTRTAPASAPVSKALVSDPPSMAAPLVATLIPAAPAAALPPAPEVPALRIVVSSLWENWPASVRSEAGEWGLDQAILALPLETTEQGLRRGKLVYSWRTLRGWIAPAPPATTSIHDAVPITLPLNVIAPAFLALPGKSVKKQFVVDKKIPDLFFLEASDPKDAPPAPAIRTDDEKSALAKQPAIIEPVAVHPNPPASLKPVPAVSSLTPDQIVFRATSLSGVEGALVALSEGLAVANRLPPNVNAEALAVFVPQIYHRVNEGLQELRLGELDRLCFTVGEVPWEIVRVQKAFFAAFGRPGEPFPEEAIATLAAQLIP